MNTYNKKVEEYKAKHNTEDVSKDDRIKILKSVLLKKLRNLKRPKGKKQKKNDADKEEVKEE